MSTLTEVLRAHLPRDRYDDEGHSTGTFCTCGYGSVGEAARSILLAFVGSVAPELAPEIHRTTPVSAFDATDGLGEVQR